jgi:hypothetical protein
MMFSFKPLFIFLLSFLSLTYCGLNSQDQDLITPAKPKYKTQNAVVIIMDGARYSETMGDSSKHYIPYIHEVIAPFGVTNSSFYNDGPTYTLAGHTAICTGYYQEINNGGIENPVHPSYFQYFNQKNSIKQTACYIVASKDKLSVLANCSDHIWRNNFLPSFDCGTDGSGVGCGYRNDSLTCIRAKEILAQDHPRLMLINFQEPDASGHTGVWSKYVNAISKTDRYIHDIWKFLQSDKYYRSTTAIFITNDHGRHADGVLGGFANHGCPCDGCRHLMFVAAGPDFKTKAVIQQHYELRDIPATIAELMGFPFPCDGDVMQELIK